MTVGFFLLTRGYVRGRKPASPAMSACIFGMVSCLGALVSTSCMGTAERVDVESLMPRNPDPYQDAREFSERVLRALFRFTTTAGFVDAREASRDALLVQLYLDPRHWVQALAKEDPNKVVAFLEYYGGYAPEGDEVLLESFRRRVVSQLKGRSPHSSTEKRLQQIILDLYEVHP